MAEKWTLTWIEKTSSGYIGYAMVDREADTPTGRALVATLDVFGCATVDDAREIVRRRVEAMGGTLEDLTVADPEGRIR